MDTECSYMSLPDFEKEVEEDIISIKKTMGTFPSIHKMLINTWVFITLVILFDILFLIKEPNFVTYWIVSAFLIYMFNWLILMIPASRNKTCGVLPMIEKTGKDEGPASIWSMIKEEKEKKASQKKSIKKTITRKKIIPFGEIVWNIFFINSQPLAPMFILVFAINIFLAAYCLVTGAVLENRTAIIVIVQAVAIIAYYAAIWHIKPYNPGFFMDIVDARKDYQQKKINEGIKSALFFTMLFGMFMAIGGTLIIFAMLVPGLAFGQIMRLESCQADLTSLIKLFIILLSQIVLFRISQGIFSTRLLKSSYKDRLKLLEEEIVPQIHFYKKKQNHSDEIEIELLKVEKEYINTKIYKPTCHDLFGLLFVYVITPDIKTILTRYLKIQKRIDELEESQFSVHSTTAP